MRRIAFFIAALLAVVPVSVAVSANAAPPTVVSATNPSSISLTSPGQFVVQSVTITKGTWSLFAKASVIGGSTAGDFFRCELVDTTHAAVLDGSTSFVGPLLPRDVITNVALFTAKGRVTITQECGHDGTAGNTGFVDFNASLVGFASAAADVRIARSTEQKPITPSVSEDVVNLKLTAGDWVVAEKTSPVVLSEPSAEVTCTNESITGGQQRDLGTAAGLHAVSTIFTAGAVATTKASTLHLRCSTGSSGTYIDPGSVLWAWKTSALKRASAIGCPVSGTTASSTRALVVTQISQCNIDPGTRSSSLLHAHLVPGTWIAMGGVFDLASQGANVADCQLYDPNQAVVVDESDASDSTVTGIPVTGLANLAVVTAQHARSIDGDCGNTMTGPSAVSTAASWVFLRP